MTTRDLNITKALGDGIENGTVDSTGIQLELGFSDLAKAYKEEAADAEFSNLSAGGHDWWVPNHHKQQVYNTTSTVKVNNFKKFADLIEGQFRHGGDKYKLQGFEDREATDVISSIFGGETEFDWVLGTMMKYLLRFKNFEREKDLLKIATYAYILWLKQGNHLKEERHDTDTSR